MIAAATTAPERRDLDQRRLLLRCTRGASVDDHLAGRTVDAADVDCVPNRESIARALIRRLGSLESRLSQPFLLTWLADSFVAGLRPRQ